MQLNTEGIVLRQTGATNGTRMLSIFTGKYGKLPVGTKIGYKGKKKSALALRPFTLGEYQIFKNRGYYNLDGAEVIQSYYSIGEDIEKYMVAAYALELTDKLLQEEVALPDLFALMKQFLEFLSVRRSSPETLLLAYEIKILKRLGTFPMLECCVACGSTENLEYFSVKDGGIMCRKCKEKQRDSLIFDGKFGIIEIIRYFERTSFAAFSKVALDKETSRQLQRILRQYMARHLDVVNLKSESIPEDLKI